MKHKHKYGPWKLYKPWDKRKVGDKEFVASQRMPPFWYQSCECGFENWIRKESKPKASFKFMAHWGSRSL